MAAPLLDSTPAGLRVLADVAEILAGGLATEDAIAQVMQVLRRSLSLATARLWLRTPDGAGYLPIGAPGDETSPGSFHPVGPDWYRRGADRSDTASGTLLRFPLQHEDEGLGALDLVVPPGQPSAAVHDLGIVV